MTHLIKMKKTHLALLALLTPGLVTSCVSPLSKAQKEKLSQINVPNATIKANAYVKPAMMSNSTAGTIGLVSGLTGGLVGGAIAVAVVAGAESRHGKNNKDLFSMIETNTPNDLGNMIALKLTDHLKAHPFYSSRLSDSADARGQIRVNVTRYTLEKIGTYHSPAIFVEVGLFLDGKKIRSFIKMIDGYNGGKVMGAPKQEVVSAASETYGSDPKLLRTHYEVVVGYLAEEIMKDLHLISGEKGKWIKAQTPASQATN